MEHSLLTGILNFCLYFGGALVALIVFKYIYAFLTPHDEWLLIKEEQNSAAAIGFGGSIVGFSIALGGTISHSVSFIDFMTWAGIALLAQALAFAIVRFLFLKTLIQRIEKQEVSAGIMLACVSISVGILNAACMTY